MYCINCGKSIDNGTNYCNFCGNKVIKQENTQSKLKKAFDIQSNDYEAKPNLRDKCLNILVNIFSGVIFIVYLIYSISYLIFSLLVPACVIYFIFKLCN